MSRPSFRPARLMLAVVLACADLAAHAQDAGTAPPVQFSIAAQPLGQALNGWSRTTGIELMVQPALVAGKSAPEVSGNLTPWQALDRLLAGSGLEASRSGDTVVVKASSTARGTSTLPTVKVSANADATTEGSGSYLAPNASVGNKMGLPVREIPASVSVLTRQRMDDQNLVKIQDGLRYVTGVESVDYGDGTAYYRARGSQLGVEFDGVPILGGLQYQTQFDLAMYDRIEILRGPSGVLDGAGEPAGVVNLVHKRPKDQFGVATETQVGSFGSVRQMLDVTGPLNEAGTVRGRGVLVGYDGLQSVDGIREKKFMAYGALDFDLSSRDTLSLSAAYQVNPISGIDYGAPAVINADGTAAVGRVPSSYHRNFSPDWNYAYTSMVETNANLEHRFDSGWKSDTTLFYRYALAKAKYAYSGPGATEDGLSWYGDQRQRNRMEWFGADTNVSGPIEAFGQKHTLTVGANYSMYSTTQKSGFVAVDGPYENGFFSLYDPDQVPDVEVPFDYGTKTHTEQYGVYAQGRIHLADPLTLVLGGREAFFRERSQPVIPTEGDWTTIASTNNRFLPSAGLVWDITSWLTAYTNYSKFLTAQTQTTFNGEGLPPRTGEQYEAGLKTSFLDDRLAANLAVFRINDNNRAILDPDHATGYIDGGKARSQGVEVEVSGQPMPDWNVYAGYTYLNVRYENDTADLTDGTDPRHLFKLWTSYRIASGALRDVTVGGGMLAQSEISRGVEQGGYAIFNAQVGYRFNSHVSASVQLNNIFDREYYVRPPGNFYSQFGDRRNVMLTLRTEF